MEPEKTIIWMLDDIVDQICKDYCKWPEQYTGKTEEENQILLMALLIEKCDKCPLKKIGFIK